jgi:predicted Zn finger-like uncharacterized protein
MFTVCPKCALTLVVTAADLRIAQGYVRCGRCSSVFNSLPHLTDERPPPLPPEPFAPPPPPPAEPQSAEDGGTAEVLALQSGPDEDAAADEAPAADLTAAGVTYSPAQDVQHDAQPDPPEAAEEECQAAGEEDAPAAAGEQADDPAIGQEETGAGGALASSVLAQDLDPEDSSTQGAILEEDLEFNPEKADAAALFIAAPPDPQWAAATGTFKALSAIKPEAVEAREVDAAYLASMLRATGPEVPAVPAAVSVSHPQPVPGAALAPAKLVVEDMTSTPPEDPLGAQAQARPSFLSRVPPSVWRVGTPLALLLLLAQIVNHNRDALAATARFNQPLTAVYGALGVRLVPSWDLRAYDVRQLGAEASPPGSGLITVHASIKNGAPQAQPLPLLRVTLQDRFGNRIAARDVAPSAYLPAAAARMASLSAGQRIDAAMGFVDPGANAVGFEIDACLPASAGGIACANDAGAR